VTSIVIVVIALVRSVERAREAAKRHDERAARAEDRPQQR
jgi:uncharacterized membrane protein